MIFTCDNCGFIFSRSEETEQCPDCGKYEVRPANEEEQEEFAQRMAELSRSEHSEAPRIPDIEDTEISMLNSFSFRMPAVHLPVRQGEAPKEQVDRIFAALNDSDSFKRKLSDFVTRQMECGH